MAIEKTREMCDELVPAEEMVYGTADQFAKACFQAGFNQGVKHATAERDRYRELLEARVSGLEAMLTAFVEQTRGSVTVDKGLWSKASAYLAGSGPT